MTAAVRRDRTLLLHTIAPMGLRPQRCVGWERHALRGIGEMSQRVAVELHQTQGEVNKVGRLQRGLAVARVDPILRDPTND